MPVKKRTNLFIMSLMGKVKLNAREKKPGRKAPPGLVKCAEAGCRILVKYKRNTSPVKCSNHKRATNGHGRLDEEDRRLLAMSLSDD